MKLITSLGLTFLITALTFTAPGLVLANTKDSGNTSKHHTPDPSAGCHVMIHSATATIYKCSHVLPGVCPIDALPLYPNKKTHLVRLLYGVLPKGTYTTTCEIKTIVNSSPKTLYLFYTHQFNNNKNWGYVYNPYTIKSAVGALNNGIMVSIDGQNIKRQLISTVQIKSLSSDKTEVDIHIEFHRHIDSSFHNVK